MSLEVPRYDEAQVRAAPLPGPPSLQQAPLDAFGGGAAAAGVTKATQDLAETGGKIQQAKKQSDDQVAVLDAITQLQNKSHDLMYNPNTGLVMVKGKAALPASDQVMTDFNKTASDLMEGLSSPEQRLSFQHHVSSIGSTLNRDALIHADGQLDQYQNDVVKSSLAAKQDDAELHYGDRDQIEMSKEQQVAIIADQARRMGKPPEWADQQAADAVSATNTRVINRMLANQQDQTAKAFYNDVKGAQDSGVEKYGFTGADAAQVEKALEIGTTRGQSARSVNDILSQKGIVDPVTGLIDSAAAMAKVKEIPDQKVQDAARERMQEEIRQAKQNLTDKQEQNFMQAAQVVRDPSAAGRRITDVVPPAILSQVSPEQYNALERMTKDIPNDDKKWIQFETIPPQQLAKMSPAEFTQWQSNFSTENRKTALTQYRDAIDWVAKNGQTDFNQTLSFKERVDETLKSADKSFANPQGNWSQDQFARYANVLREADRNVRAAAQAKKGPLNGDEMQKAIDDVFAQKFKTSFWSSGPSTVAPALMGNDRKFAEVPEADRKAYVNLFKSNHNQTAPTDDQIQRMHKASLMGDWRLYQRIASE